MSKPCPHCGAFGGTAAEHLPNCITQFALRGMAFSAVNRVIMRGSEFIARARSHTMALRIANALNKYQPNRSGF